MKHQKSFSAIGLLPLLLIFGIIFSISACSSATKIPDAIPSQNPQPSVTNTTIPSPTASPSPQPTFTPTATPLPRLPVTAGTAFPLPAQPITIENIQQLKPLAVWGDGPLSHAVLSPDRSQMAIRTIAAVVIYETKTLTEIKRITTGYQPTSLAYSQDGAQLAIGLANGIAQVINLSDGSLAAEFFKAQRAVSMIGFGPDRLITYQSESVKGNKLYNLGIWKLSSQTEIFSIEEQFSNSNWYPPQLSPDGLWVTCPNQNEQWVLSTTDGQVAWKIPASQPRGFSPDGQLLAVSSEGRSKIYQTSDGAPLYSLSGENIQFLPDSQHVLVFEGDPKKTGKTNLYKLEPDKKTATFLFRLDGFPYPTTFCSNCHIYNAHAAVSTDGQKIALVSRYFQDYGQENSLRVFNLADGSLIREIPLLSGEQGYLSNETSRGTQYNVYPSIQDVFFDGTDTLLTMETAMSQDYLVKLRRWDVTTGAEVIVRDFPDNTMEHFALAFSPDGTEFLTSHSEGEKQLIEFRELTTGNILREVTASGFNPDKFTGLRFIPGGILLVQDIRGVGGMPVDPATGALKSDAWDTYGWLCPPSAVSPDGNLLACNNNAVPAIANMHTGEILNIPQIQFYEPQPDWQISPDGKLMAFTRSGKPAIVVDTATGQILHTLVPGAMLAFSSDSRLLATTVYFWGTFFYDVKTGELVTVNYTYETNYQNIVFSPDGTLMATATDGIITLWGINP